MPLGSGVSIAPIARTDKDPREMLSARKRPHQVSAGGGTVLE
jgi:hypothetical protein